MLVLSHTTSRQIFTHTYIHTLYNINLRNEKNYTHHKENKACIVSQLTPLSYTIRNSLNISRHDRIFRDYSNPSHTLRERRLSISIPLSRPTFAHKTNRRTGESHFFSPPGREEAIMSLHSVFLYLFLLPRSTRSHV